MLFLTYGDVKNMRYIEVKKLNDRKFKRATGVERVLFEILVGILEVELKELYSKEGRLPKLSVEDILLMMFFFYRHYPTFFKLGIEFGIDKANAYRWVKWAEDILFDKISGVSVTLGNQINLSDLNNQKEHLVDVTECTIQRPKNYEIQREYYSGKKKKHTIKIQIIIEAETKRIVSIAFDKGSIHDFNLFKKSTKNLEEIIKFLADSGYQGIDKIFPNSMTPKKKSKKKPLTDQDNDLNHLISSYRIPVEHVNCQIKRFKILADRYRSKISTFFKRTLLICEFYN